MVYTKGIPGSSINAMEINRYVHSLSFVIACIYIVPAENTILQCEINTIP